MAVGQITQLLPAAELYNGYDKEWVGGGVMEALRQHTQGNSHIAILSSAGSLINTVPPTTWQSLLEPSQNRQLPKLPKLLCTNSHHRRLPTMAPNLNLGTVPAIYVVSVTPAVGSMSVDELT